MKLNDFLKAEDISMGAFAKTVGTTTATISRAADGVVVPRKALMERIYKATAGMVTPNDLVGLYCVRPCESDTETSNRAGALKSKGFLKP